MYFNFFISASRKPGIVTVTVHSSNGRILGETDFVYYDKDRETLLRLVTDPKLQSDFFRHWANFMAVETKRTERQDLSQPSTGTFCNYYLFLIIYSPNTCSPSMR